MTYERFSQLWDALITNRPKANKIITSSFSKETIEALIEYSTGNKTKIKSIRAMLGR